MMCPTLLLLAAFAGADPEPARDTPAKPAPVKPVSSEELEAAIQKGTDWLVKNQKGDGAFGGPEKTKMLNIMASPPGSLRAFSMGTTSIGTCALIESGSPTTEVKNAIDKAEAYLMENLPKLRRASPEELYNVWGHGYGIQALADLHRYRAGDKDKQEKLAALIREQYELLTRYESVDGGWGYYDFKVGSAKPASDSTSFTNAAILVAFSKARDEGVKPPEKTLKRAIDSTVRQRKPDFTYLYGEYLKYSPQHGINQPGGSLGRSQACNLALRLWGDDKVTDDVMKTWLDRLIVRNGWLDMGRKRPVPHESHFAVAGYFYYFGHYYASGCIHQLPAADRPFYQDQLARILLPKQDTDGTWFDYPLYDYGHAYGTGFAVMTLSQCRKDK